MRKISQRALDLTGVVNIDCTHLHPERLRTRLDCAELAYAGRIAGITYDQNSNQTWQDLFEQFQPFGAQTVLGVHKARSVTARPSKGRAHVRSFRIRDRYEHDWQRSGDGLQRHDARRISSKNNVRRECDQFRRVSTREFDAVLAPTHVDASVNSLAPAALLQHFFESRDTGQRHSIVGSPVG